MQQPSKIAKLLITALLTLALSAVPLSGLAAGNNGSCGDGYGKTTTCNRNTAACNQTVCGYCTGLIDLNGLTYSTARDNSCNGGNSCSQDGNCNAACAATDCSSICTDAENCPAADACSVNSSKPHVGSACQSSGDQLNYLSQLLSFLLGGTGSSLTYAAPESYVYEGAQQVVPALARPLDNDDSLAQQVVELVNLERAAANLSPLSVDDSLCDAAALRAAEISVSFSHTRPDGSSCFTALQQAGAVYSSAGENIALGQPTAAQVVEDWMNSPGHRANIMNPNYSRIGVATAANTATGNGYAWAQFFAD